MEDSNLRQSSRLKNALTNIRKTPRDVKNEGRPGYVLENTIEADKMADNQTAFLAENAQMVRNPSDFLSGHARIAHKSTRTRTGQWLPWASRMGRHMLK
jgi:hypothetical protein